MVKYEDFLLLLQSSGHEKKKANKNGFAQTLTYLYIREEQSTVKEPLMVAMFATLF